MVLSGHQRVLPATACKSRTRNTGPHYGRCVCALGTIYCACLGSWLTQLCLPCGHVTDGGMGVDYVALKDGFSALASIIEQHPRIRVRDNISAVL